MTQPGRSVTNGNSYRFSINGQEKSDEIAPNTTTAEYWEYDSRIGRRWNTDPRPDISISPYAAFANNPIYNSDPLGDTTITGVNGAPYQVNNQSMGSFPAATFGTFSGGSYQLQNNSGTTVQPAAGSLAWVESGGSRYNARFGTSSGNFQGYFNASNEEYKPMETMQAYTPPASETYWQGFKAGSSILYGAINELYVGTRTFLSPLTLERKQGIKNLDGSATTQDQRFMAGVNLLTIPLTEGLAGIAKASKGWSFWTGPGSESRALEQGYTTLGHTRASRNLIKLTEGMPYYPAMNGQPASQAYLWWARLSEQYAKKVSGTVHVFQNAQQGVGMQSIWRLYEYPALLKNPNVTNIIYHY